jgi:hypothetical protein
MSSKQVLVNEIESLPPNIIDEILHYALFLKLHNTKAISDITLASERSLAKDWLLPEEDLAWGEMLKTAIQ